MHRVESREKRQIMESRFMGEGIEGIGVIGGIAIIDGIAIIEIIEGIEKIDSDGGEVLFGEVGFHLIDAVSGDDEIFVGSGTAEGEGEFAALVFVVGTSSEVEFAENLLVVGITAIGLGGDDFTAFGPRNGDEVPAFLDVAGRAYDLHFANPVIGFACVEHGGCSDALDSHFDGLGLHIVEG